MLQMPTVIRYVLHRAPRKGRGGVVLTGKSRGYRVQLRSRPAHYCLGTLSMILAIVGEFVGPYRCFGKVRQKCNNLGTLFPRPASNPFGLV